MTEKLETFEELMKGMLVDNGVNESGKEYCKEHFIPNTRALAIKWIKEKMNYRKIHAQLNQDVYFDVETWIKHFFNIKESDLK